MNEVCVRCGEVGQDRRTLRMECFYQMDELSVPFMKGDDEYTLRVCKDCRGSWLQAIESWFNSFEKKEVNFDANIPYRINGATVMLTIEEYKKEIAKACKR